MVSEPHVAGSEFGELQLAMWTQQFEALRDGDRFFYGNDPLLEAINTEYGIDYRRSLAEIIVDNSSIDRADLPESVFLLGADDEEEADASTGAAADDQADPGADGENEAEGQNDSADQGTDRPRRNQDNSERPPRRDGGRRGGGPRGRG
jgi:hypothetical protein